MTGKDVYVTYSNHKIQVRVQKSLLVTMRETAAV